MKGSWIQPWGRFREDLPRWKLPARYSWVSWGAPWCLWAHCPNTSSWTSFPTLLWSPLGVALCPSIFHLCPSRSHHPHQNWPERASSPGSPHWDEKSLKLSLLSYTGCQHNWLQPQYDFSLRGFVAMDKPGSFYLRYWSVVCLNDFGGLAEVTHPG